jgi:hypothetical protein
MKARAARMRVEEEKKREAAQRAAKELAQTASAQAAASSKQAASGGVPSLTRTGQANGSMGGKSPRVP